MAKKYDVAERFKEVARRQKDEDEGKARRKKIRDDAAALVRKRNEDDEAVANYRTRPGRHIHDKTDVNLPVEKKVEKKSGYSRPLQEDEPSRRLREREYENEPLEGWEKSDYPGKKKQKRRPSPGVGAGSRLIRD